MPLLGDKDRRFLQDHLARTMKDPVQLVFFTQEIACQFCRETGQILKEVAELSDKIELQVYNFVTDKEVADQYSIDKIPATIVLGEKDVGIRFYGIPSGYEFNTLIEDIVAVSQGESGLSENSLRQIARIEQPVHLQVFVTPT